MSPRPITDAERTVDRLMAILAMQQSLTTQLVTCVARRHVSDNIRNEMLSKITWMGSEIRNINKS